MPCGVHSNVICSAFVVMLDYICFASRLPFYWPGNCPLLYMSGTLQCASGLRCTHIAVCTTSTCSPCKSKHKDVTTAQHKVRWSWAAHGNCAKGARIATTHEQPQLHTQVARVAAPLQRRALLAAGGRAAATRFLPPRVFCIQRYVSS